MKRHLNRKGHGEKIIHRTAEKYLQIIDKYAKDIISKYVRDSYSIMPGNPYNLAFLRPKNLNNMIF